MQIGSIVEGGISLVYDNSFFYSQVLNVSFHGINRDLDDSGIALLHVFLLFMEAGPA